MTPGFFPATTMNDPLVGARRLALYGIDNAVCADVRAHVDFVLTLLPECLERFYAHLGRFPELDTYFSGEGRVKQLIRSQMTHWSLLLSAQFDDVYARSVQRAGEAHYRIGLSPKLYIAGYSLLLDHLMEAIEANYKGAFPSAEPSAMVRLLRNLTRVLMYDMECAISVYVDQTSSIFL